MDESKFRGLFQAIGALGGVIAVVVYFENRKVNFIKDETAKIDHEIKVLNLARLKAGSVSNEINPVV